MPDPLIEAGARAAAEFKVVPYEAQSVRNVDMGRSWDVPLVRESGGLMPNIPEPGRICEIRLAGQATLRLGESSDGKLWLVSGREQGDGVSAHDVREEMRKNGENQERFVSTSM